MNLSDLYLNRFLYRDNNQSSETQDAAFVSNDSSGSEESYIASGGAAQDINTGGVEIDGGLLMPGTFPSATLDVSNYGWGQTCAFSSTDLNTVSWGAGVFTSADGTAYNISAGNTGNMSAKTFIYLDLNVSETAYQTTTTSATAVGLGKVLIAVAENGASSATYNLSEATQIVGDNILANTIDASKITAGSLAVGTNVLIGDAFASDDAGNLATLDQVGTGQIDTTVISGGKIVTGLLTASNIQAGTLAVNADVGVSVENGGDIVFNSSTYPTGSTFSQLVFNKTSVADKGWEIFFSATGGGGVYYEGDLGIVPMSANASDTVRFGFPTGQNCNVVVHGNVLADKVLISTSGRLQIPVGTNLY